MTAAEASPLAITGMAVRIPGASSLDDFWAVLREGRECVGRAPSEPEYSGGTLVPVKGILEGADEFDAAFFDMPPAEAEIVDPQHRVLLQMAWHALEDAGHTPSTAGRVGVFVSCTQSRYRELLRGSDVRLDERVSETQLRIATDVDFLATRVAYKLDCRGPAITIQTACSSSLVAVHEARLALLRGQCDAALAGGVSITLPLDGGYRCVPGSIYASDGHCRPFDASAGGIVPGDGGAVVVLRRLDDALRDGDPIYCTLLGSATNNDGHAKLGFSAPSADGQARVIRDALRSAGVHPTEVGFIEAHGTGTRLGDVIEIEGLKHVFGCVPHPHSWCGVGSLKGNIGHLNRAAGIVGLVKAVLSLRAGVIPPTVGFRSPNPDLGLPESPFRVAATAMSWPDAARRVAGVSSFGIGGTNAHVIIGETPSAASCQGASDHLERSVVLRVSGRTSGATRANAVRLAAHLESAPLDLVAVERTLDVGRTAFPWRVTAVGSDVDALAEELRHAEPHHATASGAGSTAFLFPGQGVIAPRAVGEGISAESAYCDLVGQARDALRAIGAPGLWADSSGEGRSILEVDLFVHQVASVAALERHGLEPSVVVGHSVGELAAAFVAGVFEFNEILRLLVVRHQAIESLCPAGAMVAARLDRVQAREWTSEAVDMAATNSARVTVFSGLVDPMQHLLQRLRESGVSAQMLLVERPFHSRWMEPAAEHVRPYFQRAHLREPRIPVVAANTGTRLTPELARDPEHWVSQIVSPVRFEDALRVAVATAPIGLDLGPGEVLARLARSEGMPTVAVDKPLGVDEVEAALWREGLSHQHAQGRRVHLPGYAFASERHWPAARVGVAPSPELSSAIGPEPVPFEHPVANGRSTILAQVFRDILGTSTPAPNESFFDIGGDSLMAVQLVARVRDVLNVELDLVDFFEEPTINGLLRRVGE